jgi:hypothetical protein
MEHKQMRTFNIIKNITESNIDTNRATSVLFANHVKDHWNTTDNRTLVIQAQQGVGKTRSIAKQSTFFIKELSTDEVGANYIISTPAPSATSKATRNYLKDSIQQLLDSGYVVYYYSKDELDIINNAFYPAPNLSILSMLKRGNPQGVVIVNTSHQMLTYKTNLSHVESLVSNTPTMLLIDEGDWYGMGITSAEEYVRQTENPIGSYSNKTFKFFERLREDYGVKMIGYTGTPTEEQKNNDTFIYKSTPKGMSSKYIKTMGGVKIFNKSIRNLNDVRDLNDLNEMDSGAAIIKSAHGDINYILNKFRVGSYDGNESRLFKGYVFYSSREKAFTLSGTGYYSKNRIGNLDDAAALISSDTGYDTLVVIEAGSRGLDILRVNKTFDLSSSSKRKFQTTAQQLFGRGSRKYGNLEHFIYINERDGAISALENYNETSYGGTSEFFKMQRLIEGAKNILV